MDALRLDLRYALRTLLARPGFSLLAVLTLAIGIGVNTVAFSAINGLLLRPFDTREADRIGWIMTQGPGNPNGELSSDELRTLQQSSRLFESIVGEGRVPLSMRTPSGAMQAWGLLVSTDYLRTLDAPVEAGRLFTASDLDAADLPAVVSRRFWTERLGGGDSVTGRSLVLNGRTFSIVGVLGDRFQGPGGLYTPDVWIPLERMHVLNLGGEYASPTSEWLTVVGRLKPAAAAAAAQAELTAIIARVPQPPARTAKGARTAAFFPMADGHPELRGIAPLAWTGLAVVGIVLLIACFNVAGLLLARATERQREIGVRAALGASRGRILRQMLTEGLLLAALSGAASLVIAAWSADLLSTFSLPAPIPQRLQLGVDRRLIEFTLLLVAVAGMLPAVAPALQATRRNVFLSLKTDTGFGGRSRLRNAFVIAQIAGSTLFLAGAFLFVRSFVNARAFDPGFDSAHTLVLEISPSNHGYDGARSRALATAVHERISAIPGVARSAVADRAPFVIGYPKSAEFSIDADCAQADCRRATVYAVEPGHFDALGIPLRAGRDFTREDLRAGTRAVISTQMATLLWPGRNPLGQVFRAWDDGRTYEVIGVVGDVKHRNVSDPPAPCLYRPMREGEYAQGFSIVVRSSGDPRALIAPIAGAMQAVAPEIPTRTAQTVTDRMKVSLWPARTIAGFFTICGTLALVLATVGLFGVTYYAVSQRTREFGVRIALGATPRGLIALVMREGLVLTVPGVALGITAALIGGRLVARLLTGVSPADPVAFGATAAIEAVVALAACALPAWRATRADPMVALRQE